MNKHGYRLVLLLAAIAMRLPAGEDADFNKARYLHSVQEFKMAAEAAEKYLQAFPNAERVGDTRLILADSYYQLKDYPKAGAAFERFTATQPTSPHRPQALQRAAKAFFLAQAYDRSLAMAELFLTEYRPALKKADAPPALAALFQDVLYYAGESAYARKDAARAKSYWSELCSAFPASKLLPDATEGLAWIAYEGHHYDEALALFQQTARAPGHAKAASSQLMAARCLDQLARPAEALIALDHLASLTPNDTQQREEVLWRPVFLLHAKHETEAVAAFAVLTGKCPDHPNAPAILLDGIQQLLAAGRNEFVNRLSDLYLTTFAAAPDRAAVARMKSRALSALKKDVEARKAADLAVAEASKLPAGEKRDTLERPAALMRLAELCGPDGVPYYEQIVKEHAGSAFAAPARYQLAFWAGEAGRLEEALAQVQGLLKELPADKPEWAELRIKALFAAAEFAYRKDDFETAEPLLREYLTTSATLQDPVAGRSALAALRLAWCRHKRQDWGGAVEAASSGLNARPDADLRAQLLYIRGLCRLQQTSDSADLTDLEALFTEFPAHELSAHAAYRAAQALSRTAPPQAISWLDRVIDAPAFQRVPVRLDALELRARLQYQLHAYEASLADSTNLLEQPDPGHRTPGLRLLKAAALEALPGKADEAIGAYGELITGGPPAAPEVLQGLRRRAQLLFNNRQFEAARKDLGSLLAESGAGKPPDAEVALLHALCLKELNDIEGAREELSRLAATPLQGTVAFEVPFQLGNLDYVAEANDAAAGWYRRALSVAEKNPDLPKDPVAAAWLNLAWSCQRAGKTQEADDALCRLLALAPDSPHANEARMQRARILAEAGNLESALPLWKELLDREPDGERAANARYERAVALARHARYADGINAFEAFLEKNADSALARDALCGLGECLVQVRKSGPARDAFLKVLGTDSDEGDLDEAGERAVLGLAELALSDGDANQAKKRALRVLPGSKWFDAALYLCGRASENLAEPEKAIGYYRKLISDCPESPRIETARERLKALGAP